MVAPHQKLIPFRLTGCPDVRTIRCSTVRGRDLHLDACIRLHPSQWYMRLTGIPKMYRR